MTYQNALAIAETTRRNLETDPNEQNDTNETPNLLPPMALHDTPVFQSATDSFTTIYVNMISNSHWHHYLIDFNNQKIIHHHTYNVRQDCTSNMELLQPSSQPNEDGYIQLPPPFLGDFRRGKRRTRQLSSQGQNILAHLEHRCADRSGNITTSCNNLPISQLQFL